MNKIRFIVVSRLFFWRTTFTKHFQASLHPMYTTLSWRQHHLLLVKCLLAWTDLERLVTAFFVLQIFKGEPSVLQDRPTTPKWLIYLKLSAPSKLRPLMQFERGLGRPISGSQICLAFELMQADGCWIGSSSSPSLIQSPTSIAPVTTDLGFSLRKTCHFKWRFFKIIPVKYTMNCEYEIKHRCPPRRDGLFQFLQWDPSPVARLHLWVVDDFKSRWKRGDYSWHHLILYRYSVTVIIDIRLHAQQWGHISKCNLQYRIASMHQYYALLAWRYCTWLISRNWK